eukprot:GHVU01202277.1.p1 GENE.GHVU01202277.1~~GHVU01202277.1.p1  ORF type:complete len:105 (-),score=3.18 GHVU01202277.1:52-366(-)
MDGGQLHTQGARPLAHFLCRCCCMWLAAGGTVCVCVCVCAYSCARTHRWIHSFTHTDLGSSPKYGIIMELLLLVPLLFCNALVFNRGERVEVRRCVCVRVSLCQ